jgi:outer membrane protein assembly factor BamB
MKPHTAAHWQSGSGMRLPFAVLILFVTSLAGAGENWPEFRGPTGDGHAAAQGLPLRWSEKENIIWKTPIHDKGWSSPVVWGNQVWLTTARADGKELFAVCVDRDSGKIIYDLKLFDVAVPGFCPPLNSYASPTPAIEIGRVYVHFGSYGTACLDTATGKVIWARRDLPCNHFRAPGSSPILFGDRLLIHFDGYDFQYVVALDKATGRTAWQRARDIDYGTDNGDLKKAFGTPAIVEVHGRPQLLSPSAVATIAYDPVTGRELWKVYHGGMNVSARPVAGHGLVFITTGDYGRSRLLAVRPDGKGDVTASHVAWKYNRGVPSRSSLLLVDDLLYMANEEGVVQCLEARTGREVWQERLRGQFWASPVFADGRLYFFDQDGAAHVLQPGRTFHKLATNQLDDGCMASPAIVDRALFVRTRTHLYRVEQQGPHSRQ